MQGPRSEALENSIKSYLQKFQNEYNSYKDKMEGEARRARMKEELRAYTNDQHSDEIKKLAIETWNKMIVAEMGFGDKKTYIPIKQTEEITDVVIAQLEPVIGTVAPIHSKGFRAKIREAIADFGSGVKDVLGSAIKGITLPAQIESYKAKAYRSDNHKGIAKRLGNKFSQPQVKTSQSQLSTYQLDFSDPEIPPKDKKYIIHFNGNAEFANKTLDTLAAEANEHKCVSITFDYPGVGDSTGKSYRSKYMVDAGLAQVQRLLDMGVPAENIMLSGQSIGGGIATLTAAKLHEKGQKVSLFNQRSFGKLSDVPEAAIVGALGVIGKPLAKLVSFVIKKAGWEINAIKAWNKIPDKYKEYCYAVNDEVIPPHAAGLAGAIDKQRAKESDKAKVEEDKKKDPERALMVGHNDHIYNQQNVDGEIDHHHQRNENGGNASKHYDNFVRNRFAKLDHVLDLSHKQALADIGKAMQRIHHKEPKAGQKVLFGFKSNNKMSDRIIEILKEIGVSGKMTNNQLAALQQYSESEHKKSKKHTPQHIKGLDEFLKKIQPPTETKVQDAKAKLRGNQ